MEIRTYLRAFVHSVSNGHRANGHRAAAAPAVPLNGHGERAMEQLRELFDTDLGGRMLVVVSNREPYVHTYGSERLECVSPIGGLTAALDPVMRACGGTWIAHGSGSADQAMADPDGKLPVPPRDPKYTLRRVWLSEEQTEGYYSGFANQGLWPLCHMVYQRPVFEERAWRIYQEVNEVFADAVAAEVGSREAIVFVQDYHLALLPRMIRERCPSALIAHFWHIPWPSKDTFSICPWREELVDGLLGNDLLAFHTRSDCENFLETVDRTLEALVDREQFRVTRGGRRTALRAFPIGIDFESMIRQAQDQAVEQEMERLRAVYRLPERCVGLGIDRVDYTKGIPDRLRALGLFWEAHPEYREKVVFFQIGASSRTSIDAYRQLNAEVRALIEDLNRRFGTERWQPVVYLQGEMISQTSLMALRRLADFCVVNSLHDGMNLVAKEYVAAQLDDDGVLVLSHFTGAARELPEAVLVNPYSTEQIADAIRYAVEMPRDERRQRMRRMRRTVQTNSIYKWAGDIFSELATLPLRR